MKTRFFTVLLCFVFHLSSIIAQDYTPFYLDNARWVMEIVHPVLGPGDGYSFWEIYTTNQDTVVNGQTYRVTAMKNLCEQWPNSNGDLYYNNNIITNEFVIGGLREEDQRVYFLRFHQLPYWRILQPTIEYFELGVDYLLYDYNITLPDTIHYKDVEVTYTQNGDTMSTVIEYYSIIDEELPAQQDHRQYQIRNSSAFVFPHETGALLEGIGSDYGLFSSYGSSLHTLRCFSIDDIPLLFDDECDPCADYDNVITTAGPDSSSKIAPLIAPNPVGHQLRLQFSGQPQASPFQIVDLRGRVLINGKLEASLNNAVDVSKLSRGYYFLKIYEADTVHILKFVKG